MPAYARKTMGICCVLQDVEDGPIDAPKTVEEVRKEPYTLPSR